MALGRVAAPCIPSTNALYAEILVSTGLVFLSLLTAIFPDDRIPGAGRSLSYAVIASCYWGGSTVTKKMRMSEITARSVQIMVTLSSVASVLLLLLLIGNSVSVDSESTETREQVTTRGDTLGLLFLALTLFEAQVIAGWPESVELLNYGALTASNATDSNATDSNANARRANI